MQRVTWLEEFLFPNGRWKSWEPLVSAFAMVELVLLLAVLLFLPRMLFFSPENWAESSGVVLMLSAFLLSVFRQFQRWLANRHLIWLRKNHPTAIQGENDGLERLLNKRLMPSTVTILLLGGVGAIHTMGTNGLGYPADMLFWMELQWPVILGLLFCIALEACHLWQIHREIRSYERKSKILSVSSASSEGKL